MRQTLAILLTLTAICLQAQDMYTVSGTVAENASKDPIDYATVVLKNDNGEILAGSTSSDGGEFLLESEAAPASLEISFIGFTTLVIKDLEFDKGVSELGTIYLGEDATALEEIEITAEKSSTEFKLDKRIFNVGTDLSTTGASALEVLNNVPSVNVNIEGQISLRGSAGVQVLINGKPSILADEGANALGTITADMMDRVEVITNPSAKYEAEGTAGIINIVLKKDEKKGLNGSVSLNAGTPHNHSVGLSMNRRTEKFNLFTQLGLGYRELPRHNKNINIDKSANSELQTEGTEYRNEVIYNLILGSDYYIDQNNVITLSGSYSLEIEDQPSETEFNLLNDSFLESTWQRNEVTEATNPKYQYELQYKRDYTDHEDHQLLFSAIGQFFGKEQSSEFTNTYTLGSTDLYDQITDTEFEEGKYTFKLDYTRPFMDKYKIETGAQFLTNQVSNDYSVSDLIDGEYVLDEGLTNVFEYNQKVLGAYGTGSYEGKYWGLQLGMRVEYTDLSTLLINTNERQQPEIYQPVPFCTQFI